MKLRRLDRLLVDALPVGSLYAVGGRVRDELRGVTSEPADADYVATGISLDELLGRLGPLGKVNLVGASFAVIKLTVAAETADIGLPRRERSVGVGHREFEVQSGPEVPLEHDLARRDFRMNMMARALPSGELVDPYGGEADIRAARIDILTAASFHEDPLRMLRAAQFAARFDYLVTPQVRSAMIEAAPLVRSVSVERVQDELIKLFGKARRPSIGLELLRETGVLAYLWPELLEGVDVEQNQYHAYDVWRHSMETVDASSIDDTTLRLAGLLHDVGKPRTKQGPHFYRHELEGADMAREMLARLRFPNEVVKSVEHLVRQHMYSADPALSDAAVRRFIRRVEPAYVARLFALRRADIAASGLPERDGSNAEFEARVRAEITRNAPFSIRDLALTGGDVIAALIARGEAPSDFRGDERVGAVLRWLFEQVTDEPERNERSLLLQMVEQYLARESAP